MTVLITLTTIGVDAGPFDLYSSVDGFTSAFDFAVPAASLLAGYPASSVPDYTNTIRIMSVGGLCSNYIDVPVMQPLDFDISYSCDGLDATLDSNNYTGGSLTYYTGTTYFTSESAALANTTWLEATSFTIAIGATPGTYWLVIKDSVGNIKAKSIDVDCSTTTTTTTAPLDFVLTYTCGGGGSATLNMTTYTGGTAPYESGNNFFSSEAAALANTSWVGPPSTAFAIGIGSTPGTYWMVIRDSLGTLKAKSIAVSCP